MLTVATTSPLRISQVMKSTKGSSLFGARKDMDGINEDVLSGDLKKILKVLRNAGFIVNEIIFSEPENPEEKPAVKEILVEGLKGSNYVQLTERIREDLHHNELPVPDFPKGLFIPGIIELNYKNLTKKLV